MIEWLIFLFLLGLLCGYLMSYPFNLAKRVRLKERDYAIMKKLKDDFGIKD